MNVGRVKRIFTTIPARTAVLLLRAYQRWISSSLGSVCRFHPSCSAYAIDVIASFGLLRGGWLASKRLFKCHPFHPGGVDLPPKPMPR